MLEHTSHFVKAPWKSSKMKAFRTLVTAFFIFKTTDPKVVLQFGNQPKVTGEQGLDCRFDKKILYVPAVEMSNGTCFSDTLRGPPFFNGSTKPNNRIENCEKSEYKMI